MLDGLLMFPVSLLKRTRKRSRILTGNGNIYRQRSAEETCSYTVGKLIPRSGRTYVVYKFFYYLSIPNHTIQLTGHTSVTVGGLQQDRTTRSLVHTATLVNSEFEDSISGAMFMSQASSVSCVHCRSHWIAHGEL